MLTGNVPVSQSTTVEPRNAIVQVNIDNGTVEGVKRQKIDNNMISFTTTSNRNTVVPNLITPEQRNNDKMKRLEDENKRLRLRLSKMEDTLQTMEFTAKEKDNYQQMLEANKFHNLTMDVEDAAGGNNDISTDNVTSVFEQIKNSVKRKNSSQIVGKKKQALTRNKVDPKTNSDPVQRNNRIVRPPPIHIHNQKVSDTLQLVKGIEVQDFEIKRINEHKHSLKMKNIEEFEKIKELFKEVETSYFTFTRKDQKDKFIVLKGLTEDEELGTLKEEIESKGNIKIINIIQLKTKRSIQENKKLPIFIIQFEANGNFDNFKNIQVINYQKISWEPLIKKREILQCKKCQRFGHAARNCNLKYRCVKCEICHDPGNCATIEKIDLAEIYCVNCEIKGHPASFKGCPVYQKALERLKLRISQKRTNTKQTNWETPIPVNNKNGTYADMLKGNSKDQLTIQNLATKVELMADTIKKQSEQIAQLLSMITKL